MARLHAPSFGRWHRTDAIGAVFTALLIGWVLLSTAASGGTPAGLVSLVMGSVAAYVAGRTVGRRHPRGAVLLVVVAAAGVAAWAWQDILRDRPVGRPFGYDNATAAFFVQAAAAGWMLTLSARRGSAVIAAALITAAFVSVPFLVDARAAEVLVLGVLAAGAAARFGSLRPNVLGRAMVVAFLSVLVTAIALGAWDPGGRSGPVRFVRDSLSHRRLELWHESLRLIGHTPLFGVGISRFDDASPVARSDPDTSHAHNEFLELSAEAGIVAGLLLVSLVVWLILRTTDSEWPTAAIVAGVACAAAAIHACIDFVFHAPAVPLAAAYLSGAAIGRRVDEAIR